MPEPIEPIGALEWAQTLGQGETLADLHHAVKRVTCEVIEHSGTGTVTLAIKITRKRTGELELDETITERAPAAAPRGAVYWFANDGFHRSDPRRELPGFTVYRREREPIDLTDQLTEEG